MIKLEIDENNKHVLRVTASYFLALAGDVSATITDEVTQRTVATVKIEADAEQIKQVVAEAVQEATAPISAGYELPRGVNPDAVYEEAAAISQEAWDALKAAPSAASVFGGDAPKPAPYTADVEALPIALEATQAVTLPPPIPAAPVTPAPMPEVAAVAPTDSAPAPAPAPAVELDKDGLPWDARIHSESRSKVVAGTWKYKRGVDPRLVEEVEAELRAVMGVSAPEPSAPPVAAPASTPGTTPPPPAAPVEASAPSGMSFPSLMLKISNAVMNGATTQVAVVETVKRCGLPSLPALAARPDLVPQVDAAIDALLAGVAL